MSLVALILAIVLVFALLGPMRTRGMTGPWNLLWLLVIVLLVLALVGRA